jgi:hypothetical protein
MNSLDIIRNGSVVVSGTEIPFCLLQGEAVTPVNLIGIWFKKLHLVGAKNVSNRNLGKGMRHRFCVKNSLLRVLQFWR